MDQSPAKWIIVYIIMVVLVGGAFVLPVCNYFTISDVKDEVKSATTSVEQANDAIQTMQGQNLNLRGEKGDQELKGDRGEQGPAGKIGPIGPSGPSGAKGEQGNNGLKGDKGSPGLPGIKGEMGDRGFPGEKGDIGLRGLKGQEGEAATNVTHPNSAPKTGSIWLLVWCLSSTLLACTVRAS